MADDRNPSTPVARPTGKRQLTGASVAQGGAVAKKPEKDEPEKPGSGVASFFPEVVAEMKKVIWPTARQMMNYTLIVFAFLIVMTVLVWGVDVLAGKGVDLLLVH